MSLPEGHYRISSLQGNYAIGRPRIEDKSLLPKRVLTLSPTSGEAPTWEIMGVGDGKFKIKTGGSYVGVLPDGYVWAFLLEDMIQGAEWKIEAVPQHGEDAYIIYQEEEKRGWTVKEEEHWQITVGPMICAPSDPPMYAPNLVFKFTRA